MYSEIKMSTDRVDNASIYIGSISSGCKIGEVRVVNLKNVQFHPFGSEGSKYSVDKNTKELRIWLQLNWQLTGDNYKNYRRTMEYQSEIKAKKRISPKFSQNRLFRFNFRLRRSIFKIYIAFDYLEGLM